jgi:hypothetical protein
MNNVIIFHQQVLHENVFHLTTKKQNKYNCGKTKQIVKIAKLQT